MIQRVYTPRASVVLSTSTMQFKLVAIMLIVQYYKKISIPKLQVCLWGVQLDKNLQMIQVWKKDKRFSNAPWIADEDITPLVMQCFLKGYLTTCPFAVGHHLFLDRFQYLKSQK